MYEETILNVEGKSLLKQFDEDRRFPLFNWNKSIIGIVSFMPVVVSVLDIDSGKTKFLCKAEDGTWCYKTNIEDKEKLAVEIDGKIKQIQKYWNEK